MATKNCRKYFSKSPEKTNRRTVVNTLKFLARAQVQARKCNFGKLAVNSQNMATIDKMLLLAPKDLRERPLQIPNLTLEAVMDRITLYQTAKSASEEMVPIRRSEIVNQVTSEMCGRCGRSGHAAGQKCQAEGKTCSQSQIIFGRYGGDKVPG